MEVKLVVLNGKHKDREIPLPSTIFLIGRDRQCHLRPHCPLVSKLHCAIAPWAGRVRVRDLKSRNGTFLNGQPIDGEVLVGDGDRLQAQAVLSDSSSILTLEMHFKVGSPTALESGTWLWTRNSQRNGGAVAARSVTFLGGQDGPPSIGGIYDLLGQDGTALYRVNIPVTALPERWQARPAPN